ncbi:hypothetical protein [Halospeciosus flavus]|uniref:Uncharacterized protein n=1 Tax=Halospeciosus flavus TaxID=3032283 RepID=A0ABD5Z7P6_9EURY|nr:hypothetical protein [Halospeciosus flavus]
MTRHYTDAENTGLPAIPNLNDDEPTTDARQRRETMEEDVWSHRLTEDGR